ncbi:MAG TPA: Nif11-like leader peptide family natural product precursor [Prochlorococcus sp.]
MSQKRVQAFIAKVRGDNSLQENLKVAGDIEAVIAIANAAGYSINAEDIYNAKSELNHKELDSVAGRLIYQWMVTEPETAELEALAA